MEGPKTLQSSDCLVVFRILILNRLETSRRVVRSGKGSRGPFAGSVRVLTTCTYSAKCQSSSPSAVAEGGGGLLVASWPGPTLVPWLRWGLSSYWDCLPLCVTHVPGDLQTMSCPCCPPGRWVLPAAGASSGCSGCSLCRRPVLSLSTCCIVGGRGWTDAGLPHPRACRSCHGTLAGGVAQTALPSAVGCGFMWAAGSSHRDWDFLAS